MGQVGCTGNTVYKKIFHIRFYTTKLTEINWIRSTIWIESISCLQSERLQSMVNKLI